MFKRKRLSTSERTALYDAARGEKTYPMCPRCSLPVFPWDRWQAGHKLSPHLGGANVADRVEHALCNRTFAAKFEVPLIAKNKRVRARFIGAFRSDTPLPGGRDDVLKKTVRGQVVDRRTGAAVREVAMSADRFEHNPQMFVGVAGPTLVYVGVADRAEFDKIAAPLIDNGENERGHVLVKSVGNLGADEVTVVFQHWVKSLTTAAWLADLDAKACGGAR